MAVESGKPNYFVRTLLALLCVLLAAMVVFRYLKVEPQGEITAGLLALLGLLVVLVLAESFDSFSVGKLIAISREVRKKEAEVDKLEKQNASLLSQLIAVSNSQSQRQSSTTVQGDYYANAPTVQKASKAEVEEKMSSESRSLSATATETSVPAKMNWSKAEEFALSKLLKQRNIHPSNVITEAKLSFQFQGIDPVSNIQPIFDGYIKESEHETFIDIRPERMIHVVYRDRLYVMLSKIHHYRTAKQVEAHLDVIVLKVPGEEARGLFSSQERVFQLFDPAIASGLLKIHEIELTEAEAAQCRET
ncbi:hypothetical protein [Stenotrophomonas geniculata]|uniref:hypothetical protein n=1 Tax=Stenotrophomonas geniculata TaxID=86188 RepID=UPI002E7881C6|nr:hypothetical protein [Stenotrophomonas geniculata]